MDVGPDLQSSVLFCSKIGTEDRDICTGNLFEGVGHKAGVH